MTFPARYMNVGVARLRFGAERVDRYGRFLTQGDPLADEVVRSLAGTERAKREALIDEALGGGTDVPKPLRELVASVSELPFWWDEKRAARGGSLMVRAGFPGGVSLGFKSLITSYGSPAGNKPLVFSGRLEEDVTRRLLETGKFVQTVARPEGLRLGTKAFRAAMKVRLVHAQVRHFLSHSEKWDAKAWGTPINQADMAGTTLLFSHVFTNGLEQLGMRVPEEQREALLHLWRGVGWVMGVDPELLCATSAEADTLWDLSWVTQGEPDEDSRRLARALLEEPLRDARNDAERRRAKLLVNVRLAFTRQLIGAELYRKLGLQDSPFSLGMPLVTRLMRTVDTGVRLSPLGNQLSTRAGETYWRSVLGGGQWMDPGLFDLPMTLGKMAMPTARS